MDYPAIKRIPLGPPVAGKRRMTVTEVAELLDGEVVIEEKLDGKTEGRDCDGAVVFDEYLRWRHSIPYDRLPDWFVAFDVYDPATRRFMDYDRKTKFLAEHGFAAAPLVFRGRVGRAGDLPALLPASRFAADSPAEGIVVKNYPKQLFGKLVRTEFTAGITTHWLRKAKTMNRLAVTA